jgi:hypothetical protein
LGKLASDISDKLCGTLILASRVARCLLHFVYDLLLTAEKREQKEHRQMALIRAFHANNAIDSNVDQSFNRNLDLIRLPFDWHTVYEHD